MDVWLEALPDGVSFYLSKYGVLDFVNDLFAGYFSMFKSMEYFLSMEFQV
jgi:hypothetical protein